ncbi:MAG TPA: M23 family metallopeptidase [Streptosporangiaceae bacterium]
MSRRKHSGGGSSLLARVNRISTAALATNVGLCVVLCAIIERMAVTTFGVRGVVADAPGVPVEPSDRVEPPRASRETRAPIRLAALTSTVRQQALIQRGELARRTYGTKTTGQPIVARTRSTKTWTFGSAALPPPKGSPAMPDVSLYLAHVVGNRWQVAFAGTSAFSKLLRTAPTAIMPTTERQLLVRYNSAAKPATATPLMLPWKQGQPWSLVADKYGVGFSGGDGKVIAAADGRLYRFCDTPTRGGLVMLIHANGMATEYYQLSGQPRIAAGSLVKRGAYLGKVSSDRPCGGGTSEPQVRFALRHADRVVTIAGQTVGGWTFHEGTDLDSYVAVHNDQQVLPGEDVVNLGIPGLPSVPGLPGDGNGNGDGGNGNGNGNDPSGPPTLLPSPAKAGRSVNRA